MTYTDWRFASRSDARGRGGILRLVVAALALTGCADKFTLPPVPEAEPPQPGVYNVDRIWDDMGAIDDMVLGGGSLYTLTRRGGVPKVEVWLPNAGDPTPAPPLSAGQPIEDIRNPVSLVRFTESLVTFVYVADDRGPDELVTSVACPVTGTGCHFELTAAPGGANRAIQARPFEPVPLDFTASARVRTSPLPLDGTAWLVLGTAPGRIAVWLEIDETEVIRPVRSDGAFPIPELPFAADEWHDIEITYHDDDAEYDVLVDGVLLDDAIPTFHPVNAPIEVLGVRAAGDEYTVALDDVLVAPDGDPLALELDFEDPEDADGWIDGPFFVNDPAPAVLRFLTSQQTTSLQATLTDPAWLSIHGVAVDRDRTLYVSVQEQDPSDPTGVIRRGQIHRFSSTGERLSALAESGTGLGFVVEPRDLAFDGSDLLVADEALNRVQKLDLETTNQAVFQIPPIDVEEPWFAGPTEVATDFEQFIYVADTRNDRVMRYSPEGAFADTVYSLTYGPTAPAGAILAPSAIAATDSTVLVADRANERLVFLKRAEEISGGGE